MTVFSAVVRSAEDIADAVCAIARHDSSVRIDAGHHDGRKTRGSNFGSRAAIVEAASTGDLHICFFRPADDRGDEDTVRWLSSRGHRLSVNDPGVHGARRVRDMERPHGPARLLAVLREMGVRKNAWRQVHGPAPAAPVRIRPPTCIPVDVHDLR